jgi:hypothetical protein
MKKTVAQDSAGRLKSLFECRTPYSVPKGEIWVGSAFLKRAGLEDNLDNHFRLASQLGQDMVCLSVSEKQEQNAAMGYRYFEPDELGAELCHHTGFLAAVIDGPFQRMVNQKGLMDVLISWGQDRTSILSEYEKEQLIALELIDRCLEKGFDAIILADDIAGEKMPLIHPSTLDAVCSPFYAKAVSAIREAGRFTFLHCCGNLTQLLPMIKSWNLDGLAGIQIGRNDLNLLKTEIGGVLIGGIEATLLESESPSQHEIELLEQLVTSIAGQERLILSSSCGLYSSDFWGRLQRIYEKLDREEID